jgi:5'-phosphate synthase pdxT subunit
LVAPRIGVLALQGDVREHLAALDGSGADAVRVRRPHELDDVDGLVIPGGESTTIGKLLVAFELLEPLQKRVRHGMPAFGSCAGMILLADRVLDGTADQVGVGGIDMTVRRNAFGRQVDSWEGDLDFAGVDEPVHGVFIRAPWVEDCGADVEVLARAADRIVAVRQGQLLATAFHPELTGDGRVHALFADIVRETLL